MVDRTTRRAGKWLAFLAAGLPAFVIAVPLNWMLVERAHWPMPVAYAVVLVFQVTMNFFLCRWLVFPQKDRSSIGRQFVAFFAGIAGFRLLDWAVYAALTGGFGLWYVGVQLFNVLLFSGLKFLFSERLFAGKAEARS